MSVRVLLGYCELVEGFCCVQCAVRIAAKSGEEVGLDCEAFYSDQIDRGLLSDSDEFADGQGTFLECVLCSTVVYRVGA